MEEKRKFVIRVAHIMGRGRRNYATYIIHKINVMEELPNGGRQVWIIEQDMHVDTVPQTVERLKELLDSFGVEVKLEETTIEE